MQCLFLSLVLSLPVLGAVERRVDLIELNHFYGQGGDHVFDQVIFWERAPGTGKYRVQDWVLVEDQDVFHRRPRSYVPGVHTVAWFVNGKLLVVTSPLLKESWTQIDPERRDQEKWPLINRQSIKPIDLP